MKDEFIGKYNGIDDVLQIDLHSMTVYEVQTDLPSFIADHFEMGYTGFLVIHGYSHGSKLQQYVRTKLRRDLKECCTQISEVITKSEHEGHTFIKLR